MNLFKNPAFISLSSDSLGQSDDVRLNMSDSVHYQPAFYYPASWAADLLTITSQIPGAARHFLNSLTKHLKFIKVGKMSSEP